VEASAQAAGLLYKIVDTRGPQRSTALVTNIDFDAWGDYLGDPPLAMAVLDRIVDGAIVLKLTGKSYRAHRAKQLSSPANAAAKPSRKKWCRASWRSGWQLTNCRPRSRKENRRFAVILRPSRRRRRNLRPRSPSVSPARGHAPCTLRFTRPTRANVRFAA
jgi:hypothetical protein